MNEFTNFMEGMRFYGSWERGQMYRLPKEVVNNTTKVVITRSKTNPEWGLSACFFFSNGQMGFKAIDTQCQFTENEVLMAEDLGVVELHQGTKSIFKVTKLTK